MRPRTPAFRIVLLTMTFVLITNGLAFASTGSGSFMFHRFGYSIKPTNKFYWEDGAVSAATCASGDATPTDSRIFAPSWANTSLRQGVSTTSTNKWIVEAAFQWNYAAGTAWDNFEKNKPMSGALFYVSEVHVNPGWHWDGYYSTLPGTEQTHSSSSAIYKGSRVEADIWIEDPGQLAGNTKYTVQWSFSPESGKTMSELSKAFGHAHGIYIYRYWNVVHVSTGHGDPMDKISARDDLGTFGSNATCSGYSSSASSTLAGEQVQPELISLEGSVSVYRNGDEFLVAPFIHGTQDLTGYVQQRSKTLAHLQPHQTTEATVTFRNAKPEVARALLDGTRVLRFGFATTNGTGEWLGTEGLSFADAIRETEQLYGIRISQIQYAMVESSAGHLMRLQTQPSVLLVDPAVYVENGQVQPTEAPRSLYLKSKQLGVH